MLKASNKEIKPRGKKYNKLKNKLNYLQYLIQINTEKKDFFFKCVLSVFCSKSEH